MSYAVNDALIEELINDPYYRVYKNGSVWTCRPTSGPIGRTKHEWRRIDRISTNGYKTAKYKGKELKVHRIVYKKYVGKLNPELEINHKDFNRGNNTVKNLELVTNKDNVKYTITAGRNARGEKNWISKLLEIDVIKIKKLIAQNYKNTYIANIYGVHRGTINSIRQGKSWKHVLIC